jgi:uncharacterized Fe-S cluster-containing radical SAM superfamily protein
MSANSTIDTPRFSASLRRRGIDLENKRILMTNFDRSEEAKDFTIPPNCAGFGRVHRFRRITAQGWPENPLPIDPGAKYLCLNRQTEMTAQVFQNAICSWRCWYCFVDFDLLSANPEHSAFKSPGDLLDLYMTEADRPAIIDLSGGQPDLVPEWTLWFIQALIRRGLQSSIYVWSDDNLSNDYLWRFLRPHEIAELAKFKGYGRVGCFKGFDQESFSFNTKADPMLFDQQFVLMRRLVEAGFDVYGYATFTSPTERHINARMRDFVDQLQEKVHPIFPLRTVPLHISVFTPTAGRMGPEQSRALQIQEIAVEAWTSELRRRYADDTISKAITEQTLDNVV